jgi:signal transduction histidine kinase/Tfp pilus assembly protein PilF
MDLPQTSQNEDALRRSVYVIELLQRDELSSVDSLQSQLYAQAEGDSLHPSFLLAHIHEGLIQKKEQEFSSSLGTLSEAYSRADSLGYDAIKLRAMPALVWLHRFNGRYELAEKLVYDGLEMADRLEDQQMKLLLKAGHANILSDIGKFNESLNIYYELAEAYEERNNPYFLNNVYNSVALLFAEIGNYEESVKWHIKALNLQEELNDRHGMARTFNNLGIAYEENGDEEKALDNYKRALEINEELNLKVSIIRNNYNMGNIQLDLGEYEEAIRYFESALESSIANSVAPGLMYSNMGLGRAYFDMNELDVALEYLKKAEEHGQQQNSKPVLSNTFETRYELEKRRGNYEAALDYHEKFKELSDEYSEMARNSALDELVIKHNVETTRAENEFLAETLSLQREASRNKTISIVFLIIMVMTSIGFTYYFFRTRKKLESAYEKLNHQKESIHAKNSMLEKVSRERRAFLHIIIHDLRNPLSAISGSLEVMQLYKTKANAELVDIMDQASRRMHLLINSLLQVFERENMHLTMSQVVISDQIRSSMEEFQQHAAQKDITIKTDLPDFEAETHPDSIQTIASNLISNAVKYTPAGGSVDIKLTRSHDSWQLNVYDEGPGFTEADKSKLFQLFGRLSARPTGGETSTGVGLYSVKMLTMRLKGSIVLDETYTNGAGFICTFPISYEHAPEPQVNGKYESDARSLHEYQDN